MKIKVETVELSISTGYVADWTTKEGIKELIQNAIDQETLDSENKMNISLEGDMLFISNNKSYLDRKSLVLGASTKRTNDNSIGKFGEGYKLALLVLLREGVEIVINNYEKREVWIPEIKYSSKYGTDILCISIYKEFVTKLPHGNLVYQLSNIKNAKDILSSIMLDESKYKEIIETKRGKILVGGEPGCIYVNGLFVAKRDIKDLEDSYSFHPKYLKIGRDRNLIDNFDLKTLIASIRNDGMPVKQNVLDITNGKPDSSYFNYISDYSLDKLSEEDVKLNEVKSLLLKNLDNKVPVRNQKEADYFNNTIKSRNKDASCVIVDNNHYEFISHGLKKSSNYLYSKKVIENELSENITEILEVFINENNLIDSYYGSKFNSIFSIIKNIDTKNNEALSKATNDKAFLQSSITSLNAKNITINKEIIELKNENDKLQLKIKQLEERLCEDKKDLYIHPIPPISVNLEDHFNNVFCSAITIAKDSLSEVDNYSLNKNKNINLKLSMLNSILPYKNELDIKSEFKYPILNKNKISSENKNKISSENRNKTFRQFDKKRKNEF